MGVLLWKYFEPYTHGLIPVFSALIKIDGCENEKERWKSLKKYEKVLYSPFEPGLHGKSQKVKLHKTPGLMMIIIINLDQIHAFSINMRNCAFGFGTKWERTGAYSQRQRRENRQAHFLLLMNERILWTWSFVTRGLGNTETISHININSYI